MCGIFGSIGKNANPGTIRALALINRERGKQSVGFFNSDGKMIKSATDPLKALAYKDFNGWIGRACSEGWLVAGHTRYATHGAKSNRNAHPFRFERIIGSHNGVVDYPRDRNYQVDSEYLFDQINRHNGNYAAALADISGYWGLTWFDGQSFYISAHDNTVSVARADDGVWYYSSEREHLLACIGHADRVETIDGGRTIRFDGTTDTFTEMPAVVVTAPKLEKRWWTGGAVVTKSVTIANVSKKATWPPVTNLPTVPVKPNKAGRMDGYGHASEADLYDYDDRIRPGFRSSEYMDRADWDNATDMAWELGYASLDEYLEHMGCDRDGSLDEGLDLLDFEYDDEFNKKTESAEDTINNDDLWINEKALTDDLPF